MEVGPRIEARIRELGITQSELARRVEVSQTTINSLIRRPRRSSPHLLKIARALGTTAEYLTGESDDPDAVTAAARTLNYEQLELIDCFDRLSRADQQALLQIARSMAGHASPPARVQAPPVGFRPETTGDQTK
ncbi:hypothetical protein TS85_15835 [Sphingomonas hengshuiensis]|uniref:HTH cro/C1-type domain-containing protein n=2 Tax=Sphingomonas hengshuiensis TaxID=1609977 RepID=A0A7U4J9Y7_9SPHN|nr:hypothetical protein TS85_15835 [Sphingomonas hengshuiensis]